MTPVFGDYFGLDSSPSCCDLRFFHFFPSFDWFVNGWLCLVKLEILLQLLICYVLISNLIHSAMHERQFHLIRSWPNVILYTSKRLLFAALTFVNVWKCLYCNKVEAAPLIIKWNDYKKNVKNKKTTHIWESRRARGKQE